MNVRLCKASFQTCIVNDHLLIHASRYRGHHERDTVLIRVRFHQGRMLPASEAELFIKPRTGEILVNL